MLDIFTVALFGHRWIVEAYQLEKRLEEQIRSLLERHQYVDFLVGCNGDFDRMAASTVLRLRKEYAQENVSLSLILPYPTADYLKNQQAYHAYYSDVEIPFQASKAHPKAAIQIRNRTMVERADLILCYVEKEQGGAYQTVRYAVSQGKTVVNLAVLQND